MWSEVFLAQANDDWQVYEHFGNSAFPRCHALHYLQMATEKLAKAYLLFGGSDIHVVRSTHMALSRYLHALSRNKRLSIVLGMTARQLRAHVKRLLPLAYEIEKLAPALAKDGPNPEYPWEAPKGTFHVPATHEFPIGNVLLEPRGHQLIRIIRTALKKFEFLHQ